MKRKFFGLYLIVCSVMFLSSCDKDDDIRFSDVPQTVANTFQTKYPNVMAEWENKRGYYVAEFWLEGMETNVWYSENGEWAMTETDLERNMSVLPEAVNNAFKASNYANWHVDDLDKFERPDRTFYVIDVETAGQADRDLYYSPDGTLIKDEVDRENNDVLPTTSF